MKSLSTVARVAPLQPGLMEFNPGYKTKNRRPREGGAPASLLLMHEVTGSPTRAFGDDGVFYYRDKHPSPSCASPTKKNRRPREGGDPASLR